MRLSLLLLATAVIVSTLASPADAQSAPPATLGLGPLLAVVTPDPPPPVREWWREGGPRLRPADSRLALLIRLGQERSGIFRELIGRVEAGNVFVYVTQNAMLKPRLAGTLNFVGHAEKFRYLRVSLNPDLPMDQMISALGHELQHALEVSADASVQDESTLTALYRRIGRENRMSAGKTGWETDAALQVGASVRRELATGTATAARAQVSPVR